MKKGGVILAKFQNKTFKALFWGIFKVYFGGNKVYFGDIAFTFEISGILIIYFCQILGGVFWLSGSGGSERVLEKS